MRIDYMNQCPTILREYFGYMETIKGKSEKTVEGYFIDLRSFFRYLKLSRGLSNDEFEKIPIDDVTLDSQQIYIGNVPHARGAAMTCLVGIVCFLKILFF